MKNRATNLLPLQDDEQQVFDLLEAYQAELDVGRCPDKDFYLAQVPRQGKRLAELLRICDMVSTPRFLSAATRLENDSKGTLLARVGDFQPVREIGRGGMGVIYEAMQVSLERKVALKLMRFAPLENERSRKRFSNEAHAAATLQHPHIVPVYACGFDAATPYYAMQYINGISVARLIQRLREKVTVSSDPTLPTEGGASPVEADLQPDRIPELVPPVHTKGYYQWVARLVYQAAQALQYAHDCGMIHRDIKPGNLLIDVTGKLWVTDFGLAHLPGSDVTVSGETLGTPRYMSPEQIQFPKTPVDHRTDVYSLGITLYELLTLQPAFDQENRALLAHAILQNEPISPRKLVQNLPHDLQQIASKAYAKSPQERYASAQQLGEDLQRYLDDKPILARPLSVLRRVRHWARRNPLITGVSLVSLGMLMVACIIILWRENTWNEATVAQQAVAIKTQEQLQKRAKANLRLALNMLEEFFMNEQENRLLTESTPLHPRKEVLQKGIELYEQLASDNQDDPLAAQIHLQTLRRLGVLHIDIGKHDQAEKELRQAVQVAVLQIEKLPDEPRMLLELADIQSALARVLRIRRQSTQALEQYRQALVTAQKAHSLQPSNTQANLVLANIMLNMSLSLKLDEQLLLKQQALRILEDHFTEHSDNTTLRVNLTLTCNEVAKCLLLKKQIDEALKLSRKALQLMDAIGQEQRNWRWQILYARCHNTLANVLGQTKDANEAHASYAKAIGVLSSIHQYSNMYEIQLALVTNNENWSRLHLAQKKYEDAYRCLLEAERLIKAIMIKFPQEPDSRTHLGVVHHQLGLCHRKFGREMESIQAFQSAIDNSPKQTLSYSKLAWMLATTKTQKLRDGRRAVECAKRSLELAVNSESPDLKLPLAAAYVENGDWELAVQTALETIKLRKSRSVQDHLILARAYFGRGDHALAKETLAIATLIENKSPETWDDEVKSMFQEASNSIHGKIVEKK